MKRKRKFKIDRKLFKCLNLINYKGCTFLLRPDEVLTLEKREKMYSDYVDFCNQLSYLK